MLFNDTTAKRFWDKVNFAGENGCWLWTACTSQGYGRFTASTNHSYLAHRVAYKLIYGYLTKGLELDHICRNHSCVNPEHLDPVTHLENIRRGETGSWGRNKTHCVHGHEFTPKNTAPQKRNGKVIGRACRTCQRRASAEYKERQSSH